MGSYELTLNRALTTQFILPVTRVHLQFKALSEPLINLWGIMRVLERTNNAPSSLKYDISMKCIVITYHLY